MYTLTYNVPDEYDSSLKGGAGEGLFLGREGGESMRPGHKNLLAAATVITAAMVAVACGTSGDSSSTATSGSTAGGSSAVKPDFAFYKGKTINFILPQEPGGVFSFSMVPGTQLAAKMLGATINIQYVSAGSGLVGDQQIYAAANDGLTIGDESVGTMINNILQGRDNGFPVDVQKLSYVAGVPQNPIALVTCKGSPYASMSLQDILASKKPFKVITGTGTGYTFEKALFNMYGAPAQTLSGYASTADATTGCLRGDAPFAIQSAGSLTTDALKKGLVHPVVIGLPVSQDSDLYPYFKNTPDLNTFFQQHPATTAGADKAMPALVAQLGTTAITQWVAGPPGIPQGRLLALQAAFKKALSDPSVIKNEVSNSVGFGWRSPSLALPYIKNSLSAKDVLFKFINEGS